MKRLYLAMASAFLIFACDDGGNDALRCDEATHRAYCAGDKIVVCKSGKLTEKICEGNTKCRKEKKVSKCSADNAVEVKECDALTYGKHCVGNNLSFCESGKIRSKNCREDNLTCVVDECVEAEAKKRCEDGFEPVCVDDEVRRVCKNGYEEKERCDPNRQCVDGQCVPKSAESDPCDPARFVRLCADETSIKVCDRSNPEKAVVKVVRCDALLNATGATCDTLNGIAACNMPDTQCQIREGGDCAGDTYRSCRDGRQVNVNCAASGKTCATYGEVTGCFDTCEEVGRHKCVTVEYDFGSITVKKKQPVLCVESKEQKKIRIRHEQAEAESSCDPKLGTFACDNDNKVNKAADYCPPKYSCTTKLDGTGKFLNKCVSDSPACTTEGEFFCEGQAFGQCVNGKKEFLRYCPEDTVCRVTGVSLKGCVKKCASEGATWVDANSYGRQKVYRVCKDVDNSGVAVEVERHESICTENNEVESHGFNGLRKEACGNKICASYGHEAKCHEACETKGELKCDYNKITECVEIDGKLMRIAKESVCRQEALATCEQEVKMVEENGKPKQVIEYVIKEYDCLSHGGKCVDFRGKHACSCGTLGKTGKCNGNHLMQCNPRMGIVISSDCRNNVCEKHKDDFRCLTTCDPKKNLYSCNTDENGLQELYICQAMGDKHYFLPTGKSSTCVDGIEHYCSIYGTHKEMNCADRGGACGGDSCTFAACDNAAQDTGTCYEGQRLERCYNGNLYRQNCVKLGVKAGKPSTIDVGSEGKCVFVSPSEGNECLEVCKDENHTTFRGLCVADNSTQWCERGKLELSHCGNKVCKEFGNPKKGELLYGYCAAPDDN